MDEALERAEEFGRPLLHLRLQGGVSAFEEKSKPGFKGG